MGADENGRKLKQAKLLLSKGLLTPFEEKIETPTKKAMLFFGEVPDTLLLQRKGALDADEDFWEWLLVTDEMFGSEWLHELRGEYGVEVVYVEDLQAAKSLLLQSVASQETQPNLQKRSA